MSYLICGELVPKRTAFNNAGKLAATVVKPMDLLSKIATPPVFVPSRPTEAILRVMGIRETEEPLLRRKRLRSCSKRDRGTGSLRGLN